MPPILNWLASAVPGSNVPTSPLAEQLRDIHPGPPLQLASDPRLLGWWWLLIALLVGAGLTALVQSSSAITVAAIGFINAGLLTLPQAIWVIFGSNIGTTLTGWLVALIGLKVKIELFALPAIGIGMAMHMAGGKSRWGAGGLALAGFGVFFLGIHLLQNAFTGVSAYIDFNQFGTGTVLGDLVYVGLGFLLTLCVQSSSAAMALALTAAASGTIGLEAAAAVVIGANVGTTSTAILAVIKATPNARRVAAAHVFFNVLTGVVALLILPTVLELVKRGLGWATVPAFLLTEALAHGDVVCLPDEALPPIPELSIELLWHSARPLGPAAQWLRQTLQAHRL